MSARGRRHRVVIEAATDTPDTTGQLIPTWRVYADAYAEIRPLDGAERLRNGEAFAAVTHRMRLPFIRGVTHQMRARFQDRVLNFLSVTNPEERNRELQVLAQEVI